MATAWAGSAWGALQEAWLAADHAWDDVASHRDAYRTWLRARRDVLSIFPADAYRRQVFTTRLPGRLILVATFVSVRPSTPAMSR